MGRLLIEQTNHHQQQQQQQQPCLFLFQELMGETKHAFLNPFKLTLQPIHYPELNFSIQCLSSRFGWLLLLSREKTSLFFFNPLTRVRIQLPYIRHCIDVAVFSAPPTSTDCVVVALHKHHQDYLRIDTLHVGESKWTKHVNVVGDSKFDTPVQGVYSSDGNVYCIDSIGRIGCFYVGNSTWRTLQKHKWPMLKDSILFEDSSKGDILIGVKGSYGVFSGIYELKVDEEVKEAWLMKVGGFGNDDIVFLGPYGSCVFSLKQTDEVKSQMVVGGQIVVGGYKSDLKCTVYDFDGDDDWKEEIALDCERFGWKYTPVWIEPSE